MTIINHDDNPADEGYVEQGFEAPAYMQYWTHEQKAGMLHFHILAALFFRAFYLQLSFYCLRFHPEFAYQILLTVPTSGVLAVVERLTPLLHRDLLVVCFDYV